MGAALCVIAQTALGEFVTAVLSPERAYEIWSESYDTDPNPVLALETRMLAPRLGNLAGQTVLDVATGTGRWMQHVASKGAHPFGLDLSPQMIRVAANKAALTNRLVLANASALPFRSCSIDLAICSFALSYIPFPTAAFGEMARAARRVIVSDLHPTAMLRGWTRSFRNGDQSCEIGHFCHSVTDLNGPARAAGMTLEWTAEASFDLPEVPCFERAGKRALFDEARKTPAVFAACWSRKS
jgi:SAM-dependent methyltransferase